MKLLAADGEIDWMDKSGGTRDDRAWSIVTGPDDNPVVTGVSVNADETANFWTIKYDKDNGSFLWNRSLPGAVNNDSRAGWLAVADNGDIIMANRTWGGASSYDVVLQRYEAGSGDTVWDTVYNSPDNGLDDPRSLIRDSDGNLIVVGVHSSDYMVLKFDAATAETLWTAGYNGPPGWYDVANCAAIGPGGRVIVSGFSDGTGTGWDVATLGLDPDTGEQLWALRFNGDDQSDEGKAIAVSDLGDIYVVGYSYGATTNMDLLSLRYFVDDLAGLAGVPAAPRLVSAYPNPFNPRITFWLQMPAGGPASLRIFDLRGRLVTELHNGILGEGSHTISWDGRDATGSAAASGTYLATFASGSRIESRKILLAK